MDSQPNNLYETASQPDTGIDAYTFLEFNTQGEGEEFNYPKFQELSQPIRSSSSSATWPTPSEAPPPSSSDASPSMKSRLEGNGGTVRNSQAAAVVDALAAGMSGLNFEETGDDEGFEYRKGDFGIEHACKYCGVTNPSCVVRCCVSG